MSSKTRIECDFCKGEIPHGARRATLSIPKPSKKQRAELEYSFFVMTFGGDREGENTRRFDVCLGCAFGLLALAGHERRELEEA